jgi:type II secretory ATPase GspE/PulE/Tfp pilus assembly ATPase PilB-like protein
MRDEYEHPGPASPKDSADEKVHWLVRIAERAGFQGLERPSVAAGARALDVWPTVAKAYGLSDDRLAGLVADYFHLRPADFTRTQPNAALLVSESTTRRLHIYPLFESDRHLIVATCDPTDVEAERTLGFSTGRQVIFAVAPPAAIRAAIDRRFPSPPEKERPADLEGADDVARVLEGFGPETITEDDAVATPVIELTNVIVRDAMTAGATEIHVEPGPRLGAVRFLVDGVLRKHMDLPLPATSRVISRFKELARLDVVDHVRSQEGTARVRIQNRRYDLRILTTSAEGAERCTVHLQTPGITHTLDDLGIPSPELERLRGLLRQRDGIVVFTGPAGSGKTTTLYAALLELADGTVRALTVEDPIECALEGVGQTQVDRARGGTMGSALQSVLRKDPDVLAVGEIRDEEMALALARAAAKGRLILATLRADDAVGAIRKLTGWGWSPDTLAHTLLGVVGQRLLRRVCPGCAEPVRGHLTPDEWRLTERHGIEPLVRAVGCSACGFTGYRGRVPAIEVMLVGPRVQQAVEQDAGWPVVKRVAVQGGMRTLHDVGVSWVEKGRTTLVEVERALGQGVGLEIGTELELPWTPGHR